MLSLAHQPLTREESPVNILSRTPDGRPVVNTAAAKQEAALMGDTREDYWLVGCGGSEQPVLFNGRWLLYMWNPGRQKHGWLDIDTDIVEED
jgi:hypothetical protein